MNEQDKAPFKERIIVFFKKFKLTDIITPLYEELPYIYFFMTLMEFGTTSRKIDWYLLIAGDPQGYYIATCNILVLFFYAYIGAVIISAIKKKAYKIPCKIFLYLIFVSLYAISHFLIMNFKLTINPSCLVLLAETTERESSEFINQYILSDNAIPTLKTTVNYIIAIVSVEFIWYYFRKRILKELPNIAKKIVAVIILPVLLFSCGYTLYIFWKVNNARTPDNIRYMLPPEDPISALYTSLITVNMMEDFMEKAVNLNQEVYINETPVCNQSDSLNIVVIIGESYIKYHSQLYGYELNTTPLLNKEREEGRLFVFNDAVCSANRTSVVVKNILCCNNSSEGEMWYDYPLFLTIFKKAGYNISFWSNQIDVCKTESFSFTLNSFLYNPQICNICYTNRNERSYNYDEELIESFRGNEKVTAGKHNLIMFQLMGQHHSASQRFPHDRFKQFTAKDITRNAPYLGKKEKEYIADYDNATLYNDYVVNEIIDMFRESNTIIVYLSDHGDEVYDYRNQCGRDHSEMTPNRMKYQFDIPFMIWCSDIYMKSYPEKVERIKAALDKPFISDNLCNLLFNVAGIRTSYYREKYDIMSPKYRCGKRTIDHDYIYEDIRYLVE